MAERPVSLTRPTGTFPVPNALVDTFLPSLKDAEVRLLLTVLRQTWGWIDPQTGQPKERDWMTSARLRQVTGRASEAVSGAVDGLVQRGLIVVEDASGKLLSTAAERRRSAGALHFRPGPTLDAASGTTPLENQKSPTVMPGMETEKPELEIEQLKAEVEKVFSVSGSPFSESEIRKSKTTNNITNNNTSFRKNDPRPSFPKSEGAGDFNNPNTKPVDNSPQLSKPGIMPLKNEGLKNYALKSYEMPDLPLTDKQTAQIEAIKGQIRERLKTIQAPRPRLERPRRT